MISSDVLIKGKIKKIYPVGYHCKHSNNDIRGYGIILNCNKGIRNSTDLRVERVQENDEPVDLQVLLSTLKNAKQGLCLTISHNMKEKDCVEVTLQDIRKAFGRKLEVQRKKLNNLKFEVKVRVML